MGTKITCPGVMAKKENNTSETDKKQKSCRGLFTDRSLLSSCLVVEFPLSVRTSKVSDLPSFPGKAVHDL